MFDSLWFGPRNICEVSEVLTTIVLVMTRFSVSSNPCISKY